jgi:hypothetical protein
MPSAPVAQRLAGICNALIRALGANHRGLPLWAIAFLQGKLLRLRTRATALFDKLAAGTYRAPRARTRAPAPPRPPAPIQAPRLPGLLLQLAPNAAAEAASLRTLLEDPDLAAHAAAAPALGRLLRPLCRLLAIDPPECLRRPKRPRRKPPPHEAPPRPAPKTARPDSAPAYPNWRALLAASQARHLAQYFRANILSPAVILHAYRDVLTPEIRRLLAPEFKFLA